MAHQPMSGGGLDVDMTTGLPRRGIPEAKQDQVKNRYQEAVQESIALAAELQFSPALRVLFNQCRDRLVALATKDEVFMALAKTVGALRHGIEVAPILAEQEVRRIMGPQMASFITEAEQAASEEIPAE